MTYQELTGQESGIWIYRQPFNHPRAIICNWSSDKCDGCIPLVFDDGLVWMPLAKYANWEKKGENMPMGDWMDTCEIIYDENNDNATTNWDLVDATMYEADDFVILAPKGWN